VVFALPRPTAVVGVLVGDVVVATAGPTIVGVVSSSDCVVCSARISGVGLEDSIGDGPSGEVPSRETFRGALSSWSVDVVRLGGGEEWGDNRLTGRRDRPERRVETDAWSLL